MISSFVCLKVMWSHLDIPKDANTSWPGQDLLAVPFARERVRTQGGKVTCLRTDGRTGHLLTMVKVTVSAHHPGNTQLPEKWLIVSLETGSAPQSRPWPFVSGGL